MDPRPEAPRIHTRQGREVEVRTSFIHLRSAYLWLAVAVAVLIAGVAPIIGAMAVSAGYALNGPSDVFRFVMGFSPMNLLLPLIVSLPYAIVVSGEISQRYLLYTRPRAGLRFSIRTRFTTAATTGFVIGFTVPLVVFTWSFLVEPLLGIVTPRPELSGLFTPEQVRVADLDAFTFSQLLGYGDAAFGVGYALFVGVVGALYSVVTLACLFMMTNRFLAMATPWIVHVSVYFVMAVLQLAPVSPNAFLPFNLSQTSMSVPLIPLTTLAAIAAILIVIVFGRERTLDSWQ